MFDHNKVDLPHDVDMKPIREHNFFIAEPMFAIGPETLDVQRTAAQLQGGGADGAVVTFVGLVRNHNAGRRVLYLEYEAYTPLALKSFERIADEIRTRWPGAQLALHHRVGRLE